MTTLAFSERGSRSQFWAPVSQFRENGPGNYVTSASKSWVTSANHADSYVSSGQQPGAASPLESTLYLVRRNAAGVQVSGRFNGLGLRGNDSAPVEIKDLVVAQQDLLTPQGAGAPMMLEVVLPWFSVGTAAMAHGLCRAAIAATQSHLSNAGFEHDGQKLRDLPNLRARLAQMSCRTEQSRALLGFTVQAMLAPDEQTPLYVLQSRLSALEASIHVTDLAMKACGGAAFSRHLGVEQMFRDARAGWVMAPSDADIHELRDLEGKTLAVGSRDSTQARILPLHFLQEAGVDLAKVNIVKFDTDVGKHGDTGTSESDVLQALAAGRADAGTIGDLVWVNEQAAGHVDTNLIRSMWTTPSFDHCMFDALPDLDAGKIERFKKALFGMNWDVPAHRRLLELEGLKVWMPPREEGYESLREALANPTI